MEIEEILSELGEDLIDALRDSQEQKGLRASGKSARETRAVVTTEGTRRILDLIGPDYWEQQEKGRGPTRGLGGGGKSLVEALKEWAGHKGIQINPYAVARRIHKEGIKVPNRFNPGGVVKDALSREKVIPIVSERLLEGTIKDFKTLLFQGL